jgi:alpha-L-rhamnosidase
MHSWPKLGLADHPGHARTVTGALVAAALLLVGVPAVASAAGNSGALTVSDLTTEHVTNPLGISVQAPRFSWIDNSTVNGATQTAYEIRVSSTNSISGDMWSGGQVQSPHSFDITYAGKPLQPRTRYYWAVRAWGNGAGPSSWSQRGWFETAFLDSGQFGGQWIGSATTPPAGQTPDVLLRKEFSLQRGSITSARVYVAGLGIYKLYLDGQRVAPDQLNLTRTDYAKRVLYNTYDVTSMLTSGQPNAIGVSLGQGYWTGNPVLRLELDVTYASGATTQILSDPTWKISNGPTLSNSVLAGETYDARLEQPGWNTAGFNDSAWASAAALTGPAGALEAQDFPPIAVTGQLPTPVHTQIASNGGNLYDFRTTRAGWATVTMQGAAGATVTIKYGEKLNSDGTVNNNNTEQRYSYTLRGGGAESFTPSYSYNGYRYVEVDAPAGVTVDSVTGYTANTDVASTGGFDSSSGLFNAYNSAMRASILSNLDSVPTDTPMYEKNGWTGDSHLYADAAMANFGGQTFWENWMLDHQDVQAANGQLPVTIPIGTPRDEPVWTFSYIRINWDLYMYDGDQSTLQQNYDGMKLWLNYYQNLIASTGYIYEGNTFGDEEAAGGGPNNPEPAQFPSPGDNKALGTAYIYEAAILLGDIARALGHTADAAQDDSFAQTVDAAYNAALYDPTTHAYYTYPGTYRQTDNLPALMFGMVPASERQATCASLYNDVHVTWQDHLSTGAVTTKDILPVLTQCGYPEEAYLVATNPTYPGWGWWFQTVNGHNTGSENYIVDTMWEAWCWSRSQGGCLNDPARSHNHAFRGTIDDWLYQYVSGIQPTAAGYRKIQVKPYPVGDLTHASANVTSPLGKVSSSWVRSGNSFSLQVHVPVGATATIEVPTSQGTTVTQSGGATSTGTADGYAAFEVGSGNYAFESQLS